MSTEMNNQQLDYVLICVVHIVHNVYSSPDTGHWSHVSQKHFFKNLCFCHTKRRIGGTPSANPSFGMKTTKIKLTEYLLWGPKRPQKCLCVCFSMSAYYS